MDLEGEWDLRFRDGRSNQEPRIPAIAEERRQRHSRSIKDVGIGVSGRLRRRKVRVVEDIKHLHAELYVEVLRDSLDVVVFEHGEIQAGDPGADHDVSAGIPAKIETL